LVVGQPVRHRGLGWQGVLRQLEDGRAEVLVHGKRVRSRADELVPAGSGVGAAPPAPPRPRRAGGGPGAPAPPRPPAPPPPTAAVPSEINLIGVRVEPALEQLDSYLDSALLASRREVRVIHGHGTGRLRQAVRQHLRGHAAVKEVRTGSPDEGGNGATVVTLR